MRVSELLAAATEGLAVYGWTQLEFFDEFGYGMRLERDGETVLLEVASEEYGGRRGYRPYDGYKHWHPIAHALFRIFVNAQPSDRLAIVVPDDTITRWHINRLAGSAERFALRPIWVDPEPNGPVVIPEELR